jgi:hypothetical protein
MTTNRSVGLSCRLMMWINMLAQHVAVNGGRVGARMGKCRCCEVCKFKVKV